MLQKARKMLTNDQSCIFYSGAPAGAEGSSERGNHTHGKYTEPCFWFSMVILASGMVCGRVRTAYVRTYGVAQNGGHSLLVERVKQEGRIKAAV